MTRSISILLKISILNLFFIIIDINIKSQNLHDLEHSLKFADYLFSSRQYALSAEEYERVVFLDTANNSAILRLLQSYRLADKSKTAEERFNKLFQHKIYDVQLEIGKEYVTNLIINKKFTETFNYIEKNKNFNRNYKETYQLACLLFKKNKNSAFDYAEKNKSTNDKINADLHILAEKYKNSKYKKPFLAALFSTVIPGTGKVYTNNWKHGILSFMLVGVNSWQAYRGFTKHGSKSAYAWIFTGLATVFYLSNIFGSHKSAKEYNKKLDNDIYEETWNIVFDNNNNSKL